MRELAFCIFAVISYLYWLQPVNFKNTLSEKRIYWVIFIILFLFVGLRPVAIDQDSEGYKGYYDSIGTIWLLAEPTFGIISNVVRILFNDFRGVLIIYAFLGVFLKFKVIPRLTSLVWPTILIYFSTYFLLHDFTQIRAAIASGIFLLAIPLLKNKQRVRYLLVIVVAALFHYSALILLLLVFVTNERLSYKTQIIYGSLIPIGIILHFIHFNPFITLPIEVVQTKLEYYRSTAASAQVSLNVFNLVYIVKYCIFYLLLFKSSILFNENRYAPIFIKLYAISLFCYLALSVNTIFAMRISEMIGIVEIFLIPMLLHLLKPTKIARVLVWVIAISYLVINIYSLRLIYPEPTFNFQ